MIYVLTEWDGKGSGERTLTTEDKSKAMRNRECTLTADAAKKKYGANYFRGADIKCSTIDSYPSKKAMIDGNVRKSTNWY